MSETTAGQGVGHTAEIDAAVNAALQSVIDYCRFSESLADEGVTPEAVGLARAYKDVADRLDARVTPPEVTPDVSPADSKDS